MLNASQPKITSIGQDSRLPRQLFIGPTKTGTSWIHSYLEARGDVTLPSKTKETFFFDRHYDQGQLWYAAHFEPAISENTCVELAPSLFHKDMAISRVGEMLPTVKVICTLRNPIDRAVSHYFHLRRYGRIPENFAEAVRDYPEILTTSLYSKNLQNWRAAFGHDRVCVLIYEDLQREQERFCRTICDLLEIPFIAPIEQIKSTRSFEATVPANGGVARIVNSGAEFARTLGAHDVVNFLKSSPLRKVVFGTPVDKEVKAAIREQALTYTDQFIDDIAQLEGLLDRDLSIWRV